MGLLRAAFRPEAEVCGLRAVMRHRGELVQMAASMNDIGQQLRQRMHESIEDIAGWLTMVVRGYFQYHAVPGNEQRMKSFRKDILHKWLWQLRRRSQRSRWTWERFQEWLGALLPPVEILHPWPEVRFAAKHPR